MPNYTWIVLVSRPWWLRWLGREVYGPVRIEDPVDAYKFGISVARGRNFEVVRES